MSFAAFLRMGPPRRGKTEQSERVGARSPGAKSGFSPRARPARKMQLRPAMKTLAALSLFTLAPALLTPGSAHAQEVQPPPLEQEVALANPVPMPEPYQPPPDPYETEADPSQIDWPQDVTAEEATVDSYDDGYDPQAYTQFQDELSPYGNWIDDSTYGRVWVPTASLVGTDFTPYYSGGHWLLTEFGWTWVSDWSWGWAPFHYGRWILVSGFGWSWVPGTIWGPAWVNWRFGDGYVGWAALPPRGVSVTVTYGHRSPWRFTRAGDLGARRLRCLPMRDTKGMFHRTTNVANDRVLTRGATTVHINAGPRYIPNATPARLKAVAPHAFPQRAILPRPGANMSARPWIRAASTAIMPATRSAPIGGRGPIGGGTPIGGAAPIGGDARMGAGHAYDRNFPGHASSSPPSSPPRIYNPPRPLGPSAGGVYGPGPRTFGPATHGSSQTFASTGPRIQDVAPANNPPRASNAPPSYGAPHTFGAQPDRNPARVYNPPPRTFATPPAVNPSRSFGSSPAGGYNPPPRTFAAPQRSFTPPTQPSRPTFSPPQTHAPQMNAAPQRSFNAPAAGGFGSGGGMHPGGGHRR